ncbi:ABC transporter permease [Engelhardtia mirabilis]|uniref:Inner membrane transport permease YbhS n=1 Tax=Engelhardtia mirabilis TaxID=2528011 RepID=A0A518BM43_9BACT|nr:Inner membrane transport permease YbhS [Planctomycetes bacterium Pla133]QDV02370.1 Inner membrane transport permease YbhS [Planctomycetes bacterium Pla86]
MNRVFSLTRLFAIVAKEFVQMRRDRLTFAMVLGIPLMQLVLFGFAINSDPRHLPTAALIEDHSAFSRGLIAAMENSEYFDLTEVVESEARAQELIERGEVQFVLHVPQGFARDLLRGERPQLLLLADATDPAATSNALASLDEVLRRVLGRELDGPNAWLLSTPPAAALVVHAAYNPERISQYNIVPGLMGVVLTMTMVLITGLAITRESERGTMENLLATPARPVEITLGKIIPYVLMGYLQAGLILLAAKFLFAVPMVGSIPLLAAVTLIFIAANLAIGITFSTIARNQLQAMQMGFFFFLPSILLSGFMFPFRGLPVWAQYIGEVLPLTHFLRIVRGILLKGNGIEAIAHEVGPMALFALVALLIGLTRFRQTLD